MIETVPEPRAKRLRPRDWAALDRGLRAPSRRDRLGQAREEERRRRRPPLELVCCDGCGAELAMVRRGGSAWCPACRLWSGGPAERGKV